MYSKKLLCLISVCKLILVSTTMYIANCGNVIKMVTVIMMIHTLVNTADAVVFPY